MYPRGLSLSFRKAFLAKELQSLQSVVWDLSAH